MKMKMIDISLRKILSITLSILLVTSNIAMAAPIVATGSGATKVYLAPNGVPVVDINTANGAGLSHNKFIQYNVEENGIILNNGNKSQIARKAQLAGQIIANQNLNAEAKFILNEVTSPNRTRLEGFTEVLGGKADVIIANPFGITAEGVGFINTDRVTLTAGTSIIGADGALSGFNVSKGDILIQGEGINGSAQQLLDIVTRSAKIDGQINVPTLNI
ncbi:MAG: filamentous hemagglutinin N-terminal domain-containing protein, partial [Deltaproteobacteria bacterium]|nr:filamentous hemagglutinin N-terminal domain-containing protein [Deltaproteobacteria bacterium]